MRTDCRHCWSGHETLARLSILDCVIVDAPVAENSDDAAVNGLVRHKRKNASCLVCPPKVTAARISPPPHYTLPVCRPAFCVEIHKHPLVSILRTASFDAIRIN